MSLANIGAIIDFSGRCLSPTLEPLERTLTLRGADGTASWRRSHAATGPAVSLFESRIDTLPEDQRTSPAALDQGGRVLVADVRLDNRADLARALGENAAHPWSDARWVLAAYDRWGTDCARHLRGDFAFIVWDERNALLFAARDLFGVRGLLYSHDGDRLVGASTISGVLAGLGRRPPPNTRFLQNFIYGRPEAVARHTAFESVFRVPAAHRLIASNGNVSVAAYDRLQPAVVVVRTHQEAAEQFRWLLRDAVETRLRARDRVAFRVSGGFDSSSALLLANQAVEEGRCSLELRSYSAIFERTPEADEREYLDAVLSRCRHVTPTRLALDDGVWSIELLAEGDGLPLEEPAEGSRGHLEPLTRRAVCDGCNVIIGGTWADQLLFRNPFAFTELMWDLPVTAIPCEWRHFRPFVTARGLLKAGPALLRRAARASAKAGIGHPPEWAHTMLLRHRFIHSRHAAVMNYFDRIARHTSAEVRYPYLDRRLHEFVMGLPPQFLFVGGVKKRLLRQAMADLLPPSFQTRSRFGAVTRLMVTGLNRQHVEVVDLLKFPSIVRRGLVPGKYVARLVRQIAPDMSSENMVRLQRLLAAELWLRKQDRSAGS